MISSELSAEDKLEASRYLKLLRSSSSPAVFKAKNPDYLKSRLYNIKMSSPVLSNLSDEDFLQEVSGTNIITESSVNSEADVRLNNLTTEAKELEIDTVKKNRSVKELIDDLNSFVSRTMSSVDSFMLMLYGLVLAAEQAFKLMPNFLSELGTNLFGNGEVSIDEMNHNANAEVESKSSDDTSVIIDTTSEKYGEFRYYQEQEVKTQSNKKNVFELTEEDLDYFRSSGVDLDWYDEYMNDALDKPLLPFYKGSIDYISKDFLSNYLDDDQLDLVTSRVLVSEDLVGANPFDKTPLTKSAVDELATYEAKLYLGDKYRSVDLDDEKFINGRYVQVSTRESLANPIDKSALDKEFNVIAMNSGDDTIYTQYRINQGQLQSKVAGTEDDLSNVDWKDVTDTGEIDKDHIAEAMSSISDTSGRNVGNEGEVRMMSNDSVTQNFNVSKLSARAKSYSDS